MALPDMKPPTDKALEYICVGCWSSFSVDAAAPSDELGVIVCPTCGQAQPTVDDVLGPLDPGGAAEGEVVELDLAAIEAPPAPPVPSGGASHEPEAHRPMAPEPPRDPAAEHAASPAAAEPPAGAEPPLDIPMSFEADEPVQGGAAGELLQPWERMNPDTATWKMRTSGGITFNFHGIGALMAWAASKKNLGRATLTVEGRDEWSDFAEFGTLYRKLGDPLSALKMVGRQGAVEVGDTSGEALLSMVDAAEAASGLPTITDSPDWSEERPGDEGDLSRAPRTGQNRPGAAAKATADFTFITKVNAGKGGGRAIPFMLGLLLGAATVLVLWYVGLLDKLPRLM